MAFKPGWRRGFSGLFLLNHTDIIADGYFMKATSGISGK
jgi:hypothetical protein